VRVLVRKYRPTKIHLFLATPSSGALLLGHLWDRMPPTQLYEDLGPVGGYCPSFIIPN
jgi:SMODS-associated and fused to various effectors sensor domain